MTAAGDPAVLARLRRFLLALVALGLTGTATELLLIGHTEDPLQFVPLTAVALSLAALAWCAASSSEAGVRAFQLMMFVTIGCGAWGIVLHYQGNMEFQLEMDASLSGLALFSNIMQAKAPPALAPATMAWMGLLGLAATYRHPALVHDLQEDRKIGREGQ